ncbi:hypothetical protein GRI43_09595 [Altererythrobacter luteolus]|uniref:Uncharacterized protein n=1 Tax=Pontixanthobacter luteolus TaxID=295089 RepID=A0A6I4V6T7_9SPHN|nr:hypothetical protein [Pontixanthobacter luteolus]MXP47632.1 hypothetical protein [Pontixanthobacter luteolus]
MQGRLPALAITLLMPAGLMLAGAPAYAANSKCSAITAMAAATQNSLAGLSLVVARDGTLEVRHRGNESYISRAANCEIDGPGRGFELSCNWMFESEREADGYYRMLKQRLETCLSTQLSSAVYSAGLPDVKILKRDKLTLPGDGDDPDETDLVLSLRSYSRDPVPLT